MKANLRVILLLVLLPASVAFCEERGTERPRKRFARVVTVCQNGLRAGDQTLVDETMERPDGAASFRLGIACLPETFTQGEPETLPGPTSGRISAWARDHQCYVVFSLRVRDEGRMSNAAVLVDRQGEIAGRYDKIHPTE